MRAERRVVHRRDQLACPQCRDFYMAERDALIPACASVGIEHGYTQGEALRLYLDGYHRDGHQERADDA